MELNYKSFGVGEPVLILHGMFGTLDNWQTLAKKMAEKYMVFILDLRNHGRSPHDEEMSYAVMAEDVKEFMTQHWIHEARIVGHSMGGKVAMRLAQEHPDMVKQLVVVDMAPKTYHGGHEEILSALADLDLAQIDSRREAQEQLEARIQSLGVRQFLLKNLTRDTEQERYVWKMNLPVIRAAYDEILGYESGLLTYTGPTLFIRGVKSNYIDADELPRLQSYFPAAQLSNIENAGHWVHAEQPKVFLQTVLDFFETA